MHRDFHYYGTYMAARSAGLSPGVSFSIGEFAELVDEAIEGGFCINELEDHFHWKPEDWIMNQRVQRTATKVLTKKMVQKGETRGPWFNLAWTAFHFLPNLDPIGTDSEYNKRYAFVPVLSSIKEDEEKFPEEIEMQDLQEIQKLKQDPVILNEQQLICYPESTLANEMIEDLKEAISTEDIEKYILKTLQPEEQNILQCFNDKIGFDSTLFKDALMGVKMHVYADLWAHQGFVGVRSPHANDVAGLKVGFSFNKLIPWGKDPLLPRIELTGGNMETIQSHYGHGNAIRYPDLPGYVYEYIRPYDMKIIQRNNAEEFTAAYSAMHELFLEYKQHRDGNTDDQVDAFKPERLGQQFFTSMKVYAKQPRNKCYMDTIKEGESFTVLQKGFFEQFVNCNLTGDFDVITPKQIKFRSSQEIDDLSLPHFALAALCHLSWVEKKLDAHYDGLFHNWVLEHQMYKAIRHSITKGYEKKGRAIRRFIPSEKEWKSFSSGIGGSREEHDLKNIDKLVSQYHKLLKIYFEKLKNKIPANKDELIACVQEIRDQCSEWLASPENRYLPRRIPAVLQLYMTSSYEYEELNLTDEELEQRYREEFDFIDQEEVVEQDEEFEFIEQQNPEEIIKEQPNIENHESKIIEKKLWARGKSAKKCYLCGEEFSKNPFVKSGRHHCRLCGKAVCSKCSQQVSLPKVSLTTKTLLCDTCWKLQYQKEQNFVRNDEK